jgi:hypothetical protein
MKLNIYQIEQNYIQLVDAIIEAGGEVTEAQGQELALTKENIEIKSRSYGFVIKSLESDIDTIDSEIKRLGDLKKARNKVIERMKTTLSDAMELFEIEKLETPTMKISFRASETTEVTNEELLDSRFLTIKTTTSPNKKAIKEAIESGETVLGAYIKRNKNIQIK